MTIDLGPAADEMARLVRATPDELLTAPTPCPAYSVGDLLDHIGGEIEDACGCRHDNVSRSFLDRNVRLDLVRQQPVAKLWREPG